jgi:hypothetical protein
MVLWNCIFLLDYGQVQDRDGENIKIEVIMEICHWRLERSRREEAICCR